MSQAITSTTSSVKRRRRTSEYRVSRAGVLSSYERLSPKARIEAVRKGLPATIVVQLGDEMGWSKEHFISLFKLKRSTVHTKIRKQAPLDTADSERLLALMDMIQDVQVMVERPGNPQGFDASKWVAGCLEAPNPALGGSAPSEFLDTHEGTQVVRRLLSQMETGAYA